MSLRSISAFAAILLLPCLAGGCDRAQPPLTIDNNLVLAYQGGGVRVAGHGFGQAIAGASVSVGAWSIVATDPAVRWSDTAIEFTLSPEVVSGELAVRAATGATVSTALEIYRYEYYEIPATPDTNASPLALAMDRRGALWINEEFHRELKVLEPGANAVRAVPIPHPPDPGPFAVYFQEFSGVPNVDVRTQTSALGESIIVDEGGRVWFSEGGGLLYERTDDGLKVHPNHSRVISLDPTTPGSAVVYDVPGDRNEVIGLLRDEARNLIWFAEGGRVGGGAITSLDPSAASPEERFHRYVLPDSTSYPAYLAMDRTGGIWFTEFLGNRLGRLDPSTGVIVELPLPARRSGAPAAQIFDTGGPGEIVAGPDGSMYFTESFDLRVGRVDVEAVLRNDSACTRLNSAGANECIRELPVADTGQFTSNTDMIHSLAVDWQGRLWYGQHGPNVAGAPDTLGVVAADLSTFAALPPLRGAGDPTPVGVTGIVVDNQTHSIWFNEYWSKRLSRLTLVS